jgi:hypothetical protein
VVIAWHGDDKLLNASQKEDVLRRMEGGSQSLPACNYKPVIKDRSLSQNVELKSGNKGCSLKEKLHASISLVFFVVLLPVGVRAQTAPPAPPQPAVYGAGGETPLQYAGEAAPGNQISLSVGVSALYDDNVFATNSERFRDEALFFDSHLGLTRQTKRLTATFNYTPFYPLYRQVDQYDRLNHAAVLLLTYRLTPRFFLGLHDTFSYEYGAYPTFTGQPIMSGPGSPTALNQMILPYTIRSLSNMSGLDLTFVKSRRTSLTLLGGYNQRKFASQKATEPLYNGNGASGGLTFQYRATEQTSLGILLLHQDTTFQGGAVFGNLLRSQVESTFLSVGSRLSPTVTVTVYGGPQYIRSIGRISAKGGIAEHFQGSGGGSITKQVRATALNLSLQRIISDSGGIYTNVILTNALLGVRRRFVGRWEANWQGGVARVDASLFQFATGRTDGLTGLLGLNHPLPRGSAFHISYDSIHQLSKGNLPISANFDRNRVTVGIEYQLKAIPMGL